MVAARFHSLAVVLGIAAAGAGCELWVELDRSAADAGGDAGCPICSDAFGDEGADADAADGSPVETGAPPADARAEASIPDAGSREGG